jgi:hypothetical protein
MPANNERTVVVKVRLKPDIGQRLSEEAAVLGVSRANAAAVLLAVGLRVMERITTTSKEDWERLNASIKAEADRLGEDEL